MMTLAVLKIPVAAGDKFPDNTQSDALLLHGF